MMRRHFDARQILVGGKERHLIRRRDMENMDALSVLAGDTDKALGAQARRFRIAPDRMACGVTSALFAAAGAQPLLILAMEGGAPPDLRQYQVDAFIAIDQEIAGR